MHKTFRNLTFYGFIFLSLMSGAACSLAEVKAGNSSTGSSDAKETAAAAVNGSETTSETVTKKLIADGDGQTTAQMVAGVYEYDTYKDGGEGYDNSLEIKDAGDGKLYVFLSGSYIYQIGETQSMHEAEGKGDAQLSGNTAIARLVDEEGKNCRATITFAANQATVKIPDTCHFNIALDGVYKRKSSKTNASEKQTSIVKTNLKEIDFDQLSDVVNDFDAHKTGERYVVVDVPATKIGKNSRADGFGNTSYKNLFYLQSTDDDGDVANGFLTSAALVKSLDANMEYEPASLRVTAVLVESVGKFDVYRLSFVTKIEALSDDGSIMWTATGTEPAKVKFQH
jgi:hypothetical protein